MSCRTVFAIVTVCVSVLLAGCSDDGASHESTSPSLHPVPTASLPVTPPASTPGEVESVPTAGSGAPDVVESDVDPARIVIESIDVDADLVGVGLNDDGSMQTPEYHTNTAGWYTEGPPPGAEGPAVVVAHVDGPNGTDVFWDLSSLGVGDEIVVTDADGIDHTFIVDRLGIADKDELPYDEIWPETDESLLTLITCDGPYVDGEYEDNLIVYAEES